MNQSQAVPLQKTITEVLTVLISAYPATKLTPQAVSVYERILSEVPIEALEAATLQHIATSRFFPTVAELREMALELASPQYQHLTPDEAWGVVKDAFRRFGQYRTPEFADPMVAKVVSLMGWKELCASENQVADRAHFMTMYQRMLEREKEDVALVGPARELRARARQNLLTPGQPLKNEILRLVDGMTMPGGKKE